MATYIQGIQDYIPQIQPFQPDFNFFQTALEQKQAQYQQGYNKISQIYGQLLNSNLMRQANIDRRDELFTEIDSEIQRLSGVDLSLEENVKTASQLFQPLIDNPYFRKDLVFTKQYGNAKAKQSNLRNNPNPKSDEKAWEIGDMALEYQASDFSKSSDEESLRFSSPEYVPAIDITEKLFKFAKDNDINPESFTKGGGYLFKYTNGVNAIPTIQNVFNSILASDPRVKRMFNTQAYVDRKNYISSNAESYGGDERAAEMKYLEEKTRIINEYYKSIEGDTQQKHDKANSTKKVIEEKVQKTGVDPDLDPDLVSLYEGAKNDVNILSTEVDKNNEVIKSTDAIDFANTDLESLRYRVDNAMSYFLMDQASNENAISYATSKQKVDFEVDQIYLQQMKFSHDMAAINAKFNNDKTLKLMDIVGEIMKENGALGPGGSINPAMDFGIKITDPNNPLGTEGNTALGLDVANLNARAGANFGNTGSAFTHQNAQKFLDINNSIIKNPNSTPAEVSAARDRVLTYLQGYGSENVESKSVVADAPTDWGKGLMGVANTVVGGLGAFLGFAGGTISTPFSAGIGTTAGYALGTASLGLGGYGVDQMIEGFTGDVKVTVPGYIKSSSGMVTENADGTFSLVSPDQIVGYNDPSSPNYFGNLNAKINQGIDEVYTIASENPAFAKSYMTVKQNNFTIDKNLQAQKAVAETNNENLKIIANQLSTESGEHIDFATMFLDPIKGGARSRLQFEQDYAQKRLEWNGEYNSLKGAADAGDVNAQTRIAELRAEFFEDAQDAYDDLSDEYETLLKSPTTYMTTGIKSINKELMNQSGALIGEASMYPFDSYNFDTQSFKMGMDMYVNDILPATTSNPMMMSKGAKVMFGDAFDISRDEFDEFDVMSEEATQANNIVRAFFASAMTRVGDQVKSEDGRTMGNIYYHSIAAGNANKVAATIEPSPEWIKAHGTDNGITGAWQKKIAEGTENGKITFFIDADKAKSTPFKSMQLTPEDAIISANGQLELNSFAKDAGNITITPNAFGSYTVNGYMKSYDQLGQLINNPIFGDESGTITDIANYYTNLQAQVAEANNTFRQSLKENSPNKINSLNQE